MLLRKKAQIQGQIFIYILTIIIAGFIFMFGYNAISSFTNQIETSKLVDFEIELINNFDKISSEYNSFDKHTFTLPSNYEKVCFLNIDLINKTELMDGIHVSSKNPVDFLAHPLIIDSIESGISNNVFVFSSWLEKSFDVGKINIKDSYSSKYVPFICYSLFNGKLYLNLKGFGNRVELSEDINLGE